MSVLVSAGTLFAIPAFPGAEGFGANATGGRGGSVYVVTNLDDSGPGSFRDAVSEPNRYVVFAVGGMIKISSRITVKNNLTIAGQTAPGEGITIYGNGLSFSGADNTITRYLRVRMGAGGDHGVDAVTLSSGHDIIFDHVSVSWGRDETFSVSSNDRTVGPKGITLQDCMIEMGLQPHSAGGLIQTDGGVSIIRCLYVDNYTRNPKVKGVSEFVNCIVYNWGGGGAYILGDSGGQSHVNVVNNYFIAGPDTRVAPFTRGNANFHLYAAENYFDENRDGVLNGAVIPPSGYTTVDFQKERYPYPTVARLLTPTEAYEHAIAQAGASKVRDRVDRRYIAEVTSLGSLGQIPKNENDAPIDGPGPVAGGPAPVDSDHDGMPDAWELAHGLNPTAQDHNGDANGDGYTNLEEYLNGLVAAGAANKD
ncbi:pectate lyase [Opitutaceae bacterium EW11]|nr:pectate lyase [Opitutaceae bacterium EW11]